MKKHIKYIVAIVMYCIYAEASHSQLTFSIDTLKISDVFWLSERNAWIEDFAYGPCFRMFFSIKNNGNSTVKIRTDDFNLHIEYGKAMKKKERTRPGFSESRFCSIHSSRFNSCFSRTSFFLGHERRNNYRNEL